MDEAVCSHAPARGGERVRLKKELSKAREEVRRTAAFANEISDQLTVMLGHSELLLRTETAAWKDHVEAIHRAAKLAADMTHDLLDA